MLVIIPFCQANPFKQVARLLPSAKAAAESSAIRESAMEIGKMMLKDAKVQIRPPAGKKRFCLQQDGQLWVSRALVVGLLVSTD
ncbi:hypothetical protein T06_15917 [Trichinella sp. T6]|nr:hypothetical protein T06_15917 [Trichinella sp. T6]